MKNRLIATILCLLATFATASGQSNQNRLTVSVIDAGDDSAVPNVICRVTDADGKMLSYTTTDAAGRATLDVDSRATSIQFSLLGYTAISLTPNELRQNPTVRMSVAVVNLKESTVRLPPIEARRDTMVYNVAAFADATDRHIGDVLKKMPGITVSESGQIAYQGKSISKFYIEGRDLLGHRYNQATRNLPADAVSQVQVLENHESKKILQKTSNSDRAAINLKIKDNYKVRPFGEVEGAIGASPTIGQGKLFVVQVNKTYQTMLDVKANNTGHSLDDEVMEQVDADNITLFVPQPAPVLSPTAGAGTASVDERRYLDNRSAVAAVNGIAKVGRETDLRNNLTLYANRTYLNDSAFNAYGTDRRQTLTQTNSSRCAEWQAVADLNVEHNSNSLFLEDNLRLDLAKSRDINNLTDNGIHLNETARSRPSFVQNRLEADADIGSASFEICSLVRYYDRREHLSTEGEQAIAQLDRAQSVTREFVTRNEVNTTVWMLGSNAGMAWGINYHDISFENDSALQVDAAGSTETTNRLMDIVFRTEYGRQFGNLWIKIELPMRLGNDRTRSPLLTDEAKYFVCEPGLTVDYRFSPSLRTTVTAAHQPRQAMQAPASHTPIIRNHRTLQTFDWQNRHASTSRASLSVRYRNIANMLFANAGCSFRATRSSTLSNFDYTGRLTTISPAPVSHTDRQFYANAAVDKTLTDIDLCLKIAVDYTANDVLMSQWEQTYRARSNQATASMGLNFSHFDFIKLRSTLWGNLFWDSRTSLRSLFDESTLYVLPLRGLELSLTCCHSVVETSADNFSSNTFIDLKTKYLPLHWMEISAGITNLLDRRRYAEASVSGQNYSFYALPLRGREFLLSCLVRF